jgi:hypothetical protein
MNRQRMPAIPPPEYPTLTLNGSVVKREKTHWLLINTEPLSTDPVILSGELVIRPAVSTLYPPIRYIVPGLFVGERGGALVGDKAWVYLQERWEHHPRADVIGLYADGSRAEVFVKELDLGTSPGLLIYTTPDSFAAVCVVEKIQVSGDFPGVLKPYWR